MWYTKKDKFKKLNYKKTNCLFPAILCIKNNIYIKINIINLTYIE